MNGAENVEVGEAVESVADAMDGHAGAQEEGDEDDDDDADEQEDDDVDGDDGDENDGDESHGGGNDLSHMQRQYKLPSRCTLTLK